MSEGTAKIIHNETVMDNDRVQSRCKHGLVSSCSSSGFSTGQQNFDK